MVRRCGGGKDFRVAQRKSHAQDMFVEAEVEFTGFEFTEGIHFGDGGFYVDGSLKVQVLQDGKWVDVAPTNDVGYPVGTAQGDFGPNYENYVFEFAPVKGTAIRATGMTGGNPPSAPTPKDARPKRQPRQRKRPQSPTREQRKASSSRSPRRSPPWMT